MPHLEGLDERLKQPNSLPCAPVGQHVCSGLHCVVQSPQYPQVPLMFLHCP